MRLLKEPKSFIYAGISALYTMTKTSQDELISLNTERTSRGNKLTLSNGKIVIGKGVKYIKVTGQLGFVKNASGGSINIRICKNTDSGLIVTNSINKLTSTDYNLISASSGPMSVTEGDTIYLIARGTTNDTINNSFAATFLSVEEV